MDDRQRCAREEAREALEKIKQETERLRSAVAETREHINTSRQLLAQAPPEGRPMRIQLRSLR
jgi:predicted  nucleic acid-binding Zn-ribbon protein